MSNQNVTEISEERLSETIKGLFHTNKYTYSIVEKSKTENFEHVKIAVNIAERSVYMTFGLLSNYRVQSMYMIERSIELTIVVDNSILDIYVNDKFTPVDRFKELNKE